MFSRIVYVLAVIDIALVSFFYSKLSGLSQEAYLASGHYAALGFWADYGVLLCVVFLGAYLHYRKHEFGNEFAEAFHLKNQTQLDMVRGFFCDLLPLALLVGLSVFCIRYWP